MMTYKNVRRFHWLEWLCVALQVFSIWTAMLGAILLINWDKIG